MSTIRCHFDGKVIIPDEPVDQPLYIRIEDAAKGRPGVVFIDPPDGKPMTVGEMLASGAVGAWSERNDTRDSTEIAVELRRAAERRGEDR
jgi:hypothetical protein